MSHSNSDLSTPTKPRRLALVYQREPLSQDLHNRLDSLFPSQVLKILLKAGGVIAGGFVANLLTSGKAPGDLDVFILKSDRTGLETILTALTLYIYQQEWEALKDLRQKGYQIESNLILGHNKSVIMVYHPCLPLPIQLIFTDRSTLEELLAIFDLDYVQCGLTLDSEDQFQPVMGKNHYL
jgi:hypothetical protein